MDFIRDDLGRPVQCIAPCNIDKASNLHNLRLCQNYGAQTWTIPSRPETRVGRLLVRQALVLSIRGEPARPPTLLLSSMPLLSHGIHHSH
jgi:hypothetical protein